jgi:acetyl-CoA carboxylase biotin carboxyl carrier protein
VTTAEWLAEVRRVLDHVRASDAVEVHIEAPDFRLRLVRRPGRVVMSSAGPEAVVASGDDLSDLLAIVAPLTGVFYRSPSPDTSPYVQVGDQVESDTVVGLIETMKIFNEIVAERTGRIAAIAVETGQLVHAGETLMRIESQPEPGSGHSMQQVTP